ncbi:hypothetical protein [Xenorhabdus entomophaga]|uniref:hypothetical protein n=1 Tax=Xenorhabdus entomophaga TaxID=3136257 RepID=UPI0030F49894
MNDIITSDPLSELKKKASEFLSIEEVLNIISNKLECSRAVAAEILLSKLPDEYDYDNNSINPPFFVKKIGIATFPYCDGRPLIRSILLSIVEGDPYIYEEEPLTAPMDFDDIPF